LSEQKGLSEQYADELAAFRTEVEAVLAGSSSEIPDNVFAEPRFSPQEALRKMRRTTAPK
jgi:hypothetical protein